MRAEDSQRGGAQERQGKQHAENEHLQCLNVEWSGDGRCKSCNET